MITTNLPSMIGRKQMNQKHMIVIFSIFAQIGKRYARSATLLHVERSSTNMHNVPAPIRVALAQRILSLPFGSCSPSSHSRTTSLGALFLLQTEWMGAQIGNEFTDSDALPKGQLKKERRTKGEYN